MRALLDVAKKFAHLFGLIIIAMGLIVMVAKLGPVLGLGILFVLAFGTLLRRV